MADDTRRASARAIVLDARDRVLLLRWVDARLTVPALWITPGGGLERGEDWEAAVRRELREEIGLVDAAIGPELWERRFRHAFDGGTVDSHERFFLVRVPGHDVDASGMDAGERSMVAAHRWWSLEALRAATGEVFAPRDLAALIAPVIAGDLPDAPLAIGR